MTVKFCIGVIALFASIKDEEATIIKPYNYEPRRTEMYTEESVHQQTSTESSASAELLEITTKPYFRSDYQYDSTQDAYYKMHMAKMSWSRALMMCKSEGAQLLVPESSAEVEVIMRIFKEKLPRQIYGVFVGLHDILVEGTFITVDGRDMTEVWNDWKQNEPNDLKGAEDCAVLKDDGKLNDENCGLELAFICKKKSYTLQKSDCKKENQENRASEPSEITTKAHSDSAYQYDSTQDAYYKLHMNKTTWLQAVMKCKSEGAQLLVPESSAEVEVIMRIIEGEKHGVYVGIHDLLEDGSFITVDGRDMTEVWNDWKIHEPNNLNDAEDCVTLRPEGQLNDVFCRALLPFICKKESSIKTDCKTEKQDSSLHLFGNNRYTLHLKPKNWHDAEKTCQNEGAHLAIINSEEEAEMFKIEFAKHPFNSLPNYFWRDVLLLGFYKNDVNKFITVKGTPLSESGYTNWGKGQPDNNLGNERCGSMLRDGRLNDYHCGWAAIFICERNI